MAGFGTRMQELGFSQPKPLIIWSGRTLLEWSLAGLPLKEATSLTLIVRESEMSTFERVLPTLLVEWPKATTLASVPGATRGQADTVLMASRPVPLGAPLIIFNADTYYRSGGQLRAFSTSGIAGCVGAFQAQGDRWSFAQTDSAGRVIRTAEKHRISDLALTGLYYFAKADDFCRIAEEALETRDEQAGEVYVAPLYNTLIQEGMTIIVDEVDTCVPLGTPEDLEASRILLP